MLGNNPFYRESIKRLAVTFMSLFNDIEIQKFDSNNVVQEVLKVPIAYGPKEKWLGRLQGNPDLNKPVGISLPRMGVEIRGISYDPSRKLNSTKKIVGRSLANNSVYANTANGDPSNSSFVYVPVPVDIQWELDIMTISTDDSNQILEQILPFFTPDWVNRVRLVDELGANGAEFNIPVIFEGASVSDQYEGDMSERRILIWSLMFKMKAFLIGPPHTSKIIKISKVDVSISNSTTWSLEANASPGMLANGSPTTNTQLSISPLQISVDDNWAYAVQIEDNTNG